MGKILKLFFLTVALASVLFYKLKNSENQSNNFPYQFRIDRDQLGIPHIISKTKEGLYYGHGYAVSQDRLWPLYTSKMLVQGRLAQALGRGALAVDIHNRNFDYMKHGTKIAREMDNETLQFLQIFCDGINNYAKSAMLLPFQFYLFWLNWEQIQPKHIIGQTIMYGFFLQFEWMHQLARQRLLQTVGFDLAMQMLAFGAQNMFVNRTIIDDEQLKKLGLFQQYNIKDQRAILKQHWVTKDLNLGSTNMPSGNRYKTSGSNAWAIHGNHTKSGRSIIANDPHLALIIPTTFYISEWILINQNYDIENQIFGAAIYNIPTFASAIRKNFSAWGITASYSDNKDIFLQTTRINDKKELEYLYEEQWRKFIVRNQTFKIRGQENFQYKYLENHRGPVLQGIFKDLTTKYGFPFHQKYQENETITLASALFHLNPQKIKHFIQIPFTKDYQESQTYFRQCQVPHTDIVVLDTENNIFIGRTGIQVYRKVPEMGSFIKDGRYSIYEMGPSIRKQEKLKIKNPEKGYAALTNIKIASDNYKSRTTMHEIANGRSQRLNKILQQKIAAKHKFSIEDMKSMQLDFVDEFVKMTLPGLLLALEKVKVIWTSPKADKIMEKLKIWDANMLANSTQASFYHVWQRLFQKSLLTFTDLNEKQREAIINHAYFEVYQFRLFQKIAKNELTEKQWIVCANSINQNLTNIHPCLYNAAQAFKNLPSQLETVFGHENLQKYQWSEIHKHNWVSLPFSQIPILKSIWGRSAPTGGNSRTLNVAILSHQRPSGYNSLAGATWRFITDLETTYFSIDTGQSSSIFSPFYDNFVGKDAYYEYIPRNPFKQDIKNWKTTINALK